MTNKTQEDNRKLLSAHHDILNAIALLNIAADRVRYGQKEATRYYLQLARDQISAVRLELLETMTDKNTTI